MEKAASESESAGVRFPPPFIYAAGLVVGILLDDPFPLGPGYATRAGLAVLAVGLALDVWAVLTMRKLRTTVLPWGSASALATSGPFRFTRNPIYLGYALEYAGIALAVGSWWAWPLLVPVLLVMDRYVIRREEAHLQRVFGDAYASYRARVRRWV